jgi:hypothetical protein
MFFSLLGAVFAHRFRLFLKPFQKLGTQVGRLLGVLGGGETVREYGSTVCRSVVL